MNTPNKPWAIVLAGGEGERVRPLVQSWLGRHRPKQYCTFVGTRSMFQHTLHRAAKLTTPDRMVTVVAHGHGNEPWTQFDGISGIQVLRQPLNCDTAAGIFLPLAYIRARDPKATVVLYPSDHFVHPEDRFLKVVQYAVKTAEQTPWRLVLLGVQPDSLELEYGWIQPGSMLDQSSSYQVRAVRAFLEKPNVMQASRAMAEGAVWNTLILAAKLSKLWDLGCHCFPEMMPLFQRLSEAIGGPEEGKVLNAIYEVIPARNFSSGLLQQVPEHVAVMQMNGILWSDWGKPERIVQTLQKIDKQPAFPLSLLSGLPQVHASELKVAPLCVAGEKKITV
ncbi:MAG: mannose-1-phosphate guanylyltransferase [Nitrospirales bacterium]|nr:MAG: mannose-1-phosphate guanylyltransferase [Nitrospirales bacterium]